MDDFERNDGLVLLKVVQGDAVNDVAIELDELLDVFRELVGGALRSDLLFGLEGAGRGPGILLLLRIWQEGR